MIDWIKNLVWANEKKASGGMDPEMLFQLRKSLQECEALYRAGARLCARVCPEKLTESPEKFSELMIDLHRGLLVKIFVEIAHTDRSWDPEEREAAIVLMKHVWEVDVDAGNIVQVMQSAAEMAETLRWESLLSPFVRFTPLREQLPELGTLLIRICNIIAKANGVVLPEEAAALQSIRESIERAVSRKKQTADSATAIEITTERDEPQAEGEVKRQKKSSSEKSSAVAKTVEQRPITAEARGEMLKKALQELDELIGLESVRKDLRSLINFLKVQDERERQNLPRTSVSLHTIFCGNPGTGKTTVARILGQALGGLGIVTKGHTVEADRSGLVASYAGQTGPKVNKRVDEALDGVLFIDEAYSLVAEQGEDQYGNEAVQVLLKRMEDDRSRLVVVLAGYPEPMERMLCSNPGLQSRFQRTFNFPDYTGEELAQVFESMCRKNQYTLGSPAKERLRSVFQELVSQRDEHFGNARVARNLFERAVRNLANRIIGVAPLTKEVLTSLLPEDILVEES